MEVLFLIGRILFGVLFLGSSIAHLTQSAAMAGYAEAKGVKPGRPAVIGSGLVILVGSVLVILGIWIDVGAILIGLFLLSTAILMHPFWREQDAQARQMEMIQFQKDTGLLGASLILLYMAWEFGDDVGLQIVGPLFA
ncbi:MAG TPA: DoxX family protein [Jiangellaceae bacterium]